MTTKSEIESCSEIICPTNMKLHIMDRTYQSNDRQMVQSHFKWLTQQKY